MPSAWFSILLATTLALDAIDEVILTVWEIDPYNEQQWEAKVKNASRLLAANTMTRLSSGWVPSVFFIASWCTDVALWLFGTQAQQFACVFALLPLLVVLPLARTSSGCDDLLDELNAKALRHLDCHDRLDAVETRLRQRNSGQGMGLMGLRSRLFGVLNLPKFRLISRASHLYSTASRVCWRWIIQVQLRARVRSHQCWKSC